MSGTNDTVCAADIADERSAQRQKIAGGIERKLGLDEEVAALVVAEKRLLTFAGPFDRAADAARCPGDQRKLGIECVARAEIAADVAGDDAHALRRDAKHACELVLLAHYAAAAGVKRVRPVAGS